MKLKDEGVVLGRITSLDVVGENVKATVVGEAGTITVTSPPTQPKVILGSDFLPYGMTLRRVRYAGSGGFAFYVSTHPWGVGAITDVVGSFENPVCIEHPNPNTIVVDLVLDEPVIIPPMHYLKAVVVRDAPIYWDVLLLEE
jgi:hypothetical protein